MERAAPPAKMPPHKSTGIELVEQSELWSTYKLADGAVVRCRVTLHNFRRTDLYDDAGMPIYTFAEPQLQVYVDPPESLRKKAVTDLS